MLKMTRLINDWVLTMCSILDWHKTQDLEPTWSIITAGVVLQSTTGSIVPLYRNEFIPFGNTWNEFIPSWNKFISIWNVSFQMEQIHSKIKELYWQGRISSLIFRMRNLVWEHLTGSIEWEMLSCHICCVVLGKYRF